MEVKIGDFGLAVYCNIHHKRKSVCGTFNYMAPEIFTAKDGYSIEIDIWSLGIATFIMLTGKFPF
jgi:serine/threonine protein kinase